LGWVSLLVLFTFSISMVVWARNGFWYWFVKPKPSVISYQLSVISYQCKS